MPFIPNDFIVPERLDTNEFVIRKLCFSDAQLDYEAVMSSIDIIHQTRGGSWPTLSLSFIDDQIDLAWHQREFEFRSSFAYTIMSLDETACLGCLYIYPPGYRDEKSLKGDADISFWVTQDACSKGLYPKVYRVISEWLEKNWPFKNPIFTNADLPV